MSATGQIWKMKESFKHCPGKMTYFHSPSRQVHITRLCWTWLSSKENNLSWPFNGCLWVHNRSFICTVSLLDAQVLFRPHSVVHTPLWCKALSSSHKHPPATNTHSSAAPAGDFPTAVVCRCRSRKGKTSDAWLSPNSCLILHSYLHLLKPGGVNLFHQGLFCGTHRGLGNR